MNMELAIVGIALATTAGALAHGATVAFQPSAPVYGAGAPDDPVNLGLYFTTNSKFSVNGLGFYDQPGLAGSETMVLYTASGILLTLAVVSLSDPVVDGYYLKSIKPVTLKAKTEYVVNAFVGSNDWSYGYTPPSSSPQVTYDSHAYYYGSSLTFPTETFAAAGGPTAGLFSSP
jgi:hypothetical protein